jgi:hypothetical protein
MDFHEFRFARSTGLVVFFRFLWLKKINTDISGIPPIGTPIRGTASLTLWSSASTLLSRHQFLVSGNFMRHREARADVLRAVLLKWQVFWEVML